MACGAVWSGEARSASYANTGGDNLNRTDTVCACFGAAYFPADTFTNVSDKVELPASSRREAIIRP
jgi:hypothetical protein